MVHNIANDAASPQLPQNYPHSYQEAKIMFGTRGTRQVVPDVAWEEEPEIVRKDGRRLSGTDTWLYHEISERNSDDDRYVVQYRQSRLVYFYPDEVIQVDTCGYDGETTMRKINACLAQTPFQVVKYIDRLALADNRGGPLQLFRQYVTIDVDGNILTLE